MDEFQLHLLLHGGRREPLVVGHLSPFLASCLNCRSTAVRLYSATAQKLRFKHRLLAGHLLQVPLAFKYGWVGLHRGETLAFLYEEDVIYNKTFLTIVKTTAKRDELIIRTVHKADSLTVRRIKRQSEQISSAQNEKGEP